VRNLKQSVATIVKYNHEIAERGRSRCIFETSLGASPDVCFRHIVAASSDAAKDTFQVDFHVGCAHVNHLNSKSALLGEVG
jgi:hypothetical protein